MELQLFLLLIALNLCTNSATDQPVYFSLIVSSAPTINTSGIVSAVDQVLELINSDTTILPGYCLQYTPVLDTQVSKSACQVCSCRVLKCRIEASLNSLVPPKIKTSTHQMHLLMMIL